MELIRLSITWLNRGIVEEIIFATEFYSAQQLYTFDDFLEEGVEYLVSFWIKADVASEIQFEIQNADYGGDYSGGMPVTTQWGYVEQTITPSTADKNKFLFDFGKSAATFYIDDVVVGKALESELKSAQDGPTYIEKTDEEKAQIIGDAMESWISEMVGHFKNDIKEWDVVNEPMNENGTVRDGNVNGELASDEFYWQKYLGKDYAVTAFNLARQYGNSDDKLFINDYNLEYSLDKCREIIEYVEYIESRGAQVDGIGTQMHVNIDSDTTRIIEMYNLLAATGKLIKVSELDVRVNTDAPSVEIIYTLLNIRVFFGCVFCF
ncbi:MAG: endo-1,4-beta-xylanase [Prolixibacteraceae bacterium]|jgi:endo-1,4-beta-xylanase|nr:endo-1,4-beta-xylanase [Prolixibacteraceae bacterium]